MTFRLGLTLVGGGGGGGGGGNESAIELSFRGTGSPRFTAMDIGAASTPLHGTRAAASCGGTPGVRVKRRSTSNLARQSTADLVPCHPLAKPIS